MAPWNLILCSLALLTNKSLGLSLSHRTYSSRMAASLAGQINNGSQPSSVLVIGEEADVLKPGQMVFGAIPEQGKSFCAPLILTLDIPILFCQLVILCPSQFQLFRLKALDYNACPHNIPSQNAA